MYTVLYTFKCVHKCVHISECTHSNVYKILYTFKCVHFLKMYTFKCVQMIFCTHLCHIYVHICVHIQMCTNAKCTHLKCVQYFVHIQMCTFGNVYTFVYTFKCVQCCTHLKCVHGNTTSKIMIWVVLLTKRHLCTYLCTKRISRTILP